MLEIGPKAFVASLDIDAQNGFTQHCPDELPVPEGHKIVDALNAQACFAGCRVGSKDAHPHNPEWLASETHPIGTEIHHKHMQHYWPSHCVPGTTGFKLLSGLPHPSEYDYFVWKGMEPDMHPYGACYHDLQEKLSTGLIEFLHHKKITTVLVGGLATDYCVKTSVLQLLKAGFRVIINLDACRGINPQSTQEAIAQMQALGGECIPNSNVLANQNSSVNTSRYAASECGE